MQINLKDRLNKNNKDQYIQNKITLKKKNKLIIMYKT